MKAYKVEVNVRVSKGDVLLDEWEDLSHEASTGYYTMQEAAGEVVDKMFIVMEESKGNKLSEPYSSRVETEGGITD